MRGTDEKCDRRSPAYTGEKYGRENGIYGRERRLDTEAFDIRAKRKRGNVRYDHYGALQEEADFGVLYFEVGGWMPMCGHDTIGVGTALVEAGMVEVKEPYTYVTLDTAAGLVKLKIEVKNCSAVNVTFVNAPAFVLAQDAVVETERYGKIHMDIAYGGNIYAIIPAEQVGLPIDPEHASELVKAGNYLKKRSTAPYRYNIRRWLSKIM